MVESKENYGLKNEVLNMFIKKDCDLKTENVMAAVITAASNMSLATDKMFMSKDAIEESLLSLFELKDNERAKMLLGMSPAYVKSNIGYSVDFYDFGIAKLEYDDKKEQYDSMYQHISEYANKLENTIVK